MSTMLTITGVYRGGKVEFAEQPAGVGEDVPVLVTFLPVNQPSQPEPTTGADESAAAARRAAGAQLVEMLKKGINLGGPPYPRREELYDRVQRTLDRLEQGNG
jgi:hypothetical protein